MRFVIKNTETNWTIFCSGLRNNITMIFSTNTRVTWESHGVSLKISFIKIKKSLNQSKFQLSDGNMTSDKKVNSATGWDEINAIFLKTSLNYITDPLCHICNMSLEEGIFPSKLKIANVLPLFKAEEPFQFNNYRPVSLLCILSKVF